MNGKQAGEARDRVIRVFISSTFADMRAERDELVKQVFPELRKLCESRGVTWGEVDLRWGITDEQKAEGQVLPVCLTEIRNCRPYFIGILGERYGWDRVDVAADLMRAEPWLAEHVRERKSVTELEILHGVLNDPSMAGHAFFYFRDPVYARARGMVEGPNADDVKDLGPGEAAARAEARRGRLAALKQRIRDAHGDGKLEHAPREDFADPSALAALVKADLRAVIDALYPEGSAPDRPAREAAEHEAFGRSRARVYVARPALYAALDAHSAGDGPPLVVLGESGGGKSALLANWVRRLRAAGAGAGAASGGAPLIIEHYIGATPASTDWAAMCRRVLEEFNRHFELKLEIPDKPEALRAAFANGLYRAAATGRVILVLDGLNQIEDRDQAPDLGWIPPEVPPNVRLVLSTLPGRSLDALRQRGWPTLTVELLSGDERRELIPSYLKQQYGKELSPARIDRLATWGATANPLYLRTLLEELRQWGDHATIDDRIAHYLSAATPRDLFDKVLGRWEQDFERGRPDLVRDATVHLCAARRGLSEAELLGILQHPDGSGEPLPRAHWSPLHLAADASLVSRSGLLAFAHDYLRQAVEKRYVAAPEARRNAHAGLADHFANQPIGPRQVDELPWQLARAEAWQRLYDLLAEPEFFAAAWAANQFEVKAYWAEIEAKSPLRMVAAYVDVIDGTGGDAIAWQVGRLLGDTGHPGEALAIRSRLSERYRAAGDLGNLQASLGAQAVILQARGQLEEAMKLHKEQERLCRQLGNRDSLQTSLGNQALILRVRGQLDEAMALLEEKEQLCKQLGNLEGLQTSLGNQATVFQARGRLGEAMALYKETERVFRQLGNLDGLQASLGNQAVILKDRGRLDEAMALMKEQERLCKQIGNVDSLQICLGNQALILRARGQLDEAMALHKEEDRLCRQLGDVNGLATSLGNQAAILYVRGQLDEAMALLKEKERLCKQIGNLDGLSVSLGNQALILSDWGQLDEAMTLHNEQERLCRRLGNLDGLAASLGNQALILKDRGRLDEAMALHKEEERLCRQLGNLDSLAMSLGNQALILQARGQLDEAMALLKEQERLCRQLGSLDGLQRSLGNQANVLHARGRFDEAMALHREEEHLCKQLGNPEGLARTLVNQALILRAQRRSREALPLAEEALSLARDHGLAALAQQIQPILDSIRSRT